MHGLWTIKKTKWKAELFADHTLKKNNADIIFKKKKNLQIIVFQAMLQEFFHRVFSLNFVNCNKILDSFEVIVWDNILLNCKTANGRTYIYRCSRYRTRPSNVWMWPRSKYNITSSPVDILGDIACMSDILIVKLFLIGS